MGGKGNNSGMGGGAGERWYGGRGWGKGNNGGMGGMAGERGITVVWGAGLGKGE